MVATFLSKILAFLPKALTDRVPADKILHFTAGAILGVLGLVLHGLVGAVIFAGIAGVVKEVYDYAMNEIALKKGLAPPHGVEFVDAFATTLGGVAVALIGFMFGFTV